MNTNPNVKRILCFGDSLTYGRNPQIYERFDAKHRWTGILQDLLGSDYEIIEEGLGGRTTDIDDLKKPNRNGLEYFMPCLLSHLPLHALTLLLGTNDLKNRFRRNVPEITASLEKYLLFIEKSCNENNIARPIVILISPPIPDEEKVSSDWDFKDAEKRSKAFAKYYKELANKFSAKFLDLSKIVNPSPLDGVHLDEEANNIIAKNLYDLISKL